MKISYNWLKSYLDIPHSIDEIQYLLTDIGLEVESVETFETIKGSLKGLVVGLVLEKEKHPDADKLSVCKVDIGTEILQIVCGAPNVDINQKVIVATVGTKVHPLEGESFEIKKAKIRGVESSGMICAEDEIGLGKSHDGILVLENEIAIGKLASELYNIEIDYIFEIGLTPNRTDAFSHIGVARDLCAAINFREKSNIQLKLPKETFFETTKNSFEVEVVNTIDCPIYTGILIENLKIEDSPEWLKNRLKAIGQKPINNVVDITNFVLHEFGQPLHAFDKNAIEGNKIVVTNVPNNTIFVTLDDVEQKLQDTDLMICNANNAMCIAGVYGGKKSGVNSNTTAIFLESAYFNSKSIRKTSKRLNLRTEAAIHFEKGIDPNITMIALKRATQLMIEICSGKITSDFYEIKSKEFEDFDVELTINNVKRLTGADISLTEIKTILNLLEIKIANETETTLKLKVPPFRTDVTREADVIEDILRIYGFNNVPIPTKINASILLSNKMDTNKLYNNIADTLVAFGYNEIMTNSISKSKYNTQLTPNETNNLVKLLSSINVELDCMRNNMLYTGLEVVAYNINHKNSNVKFFEFGKSYQKLEENYIEKNHLSIFVSGQKTSTNWNTKSQKTDFYYLKSVVENILSKIGIEKYTIQETENDNLEYTISYLQGNKILAAIGKVNNKVSKCFEIKQEVFFADINWDNCCEFAKNKKVTFKEVSKFPTVKRDLALLLDKNIQFGKIKQIGEKIDRKILKNIDLFDIYMDEKIGTDKKSYAVSFEFKDETKTLQDTDIDLIMNKLIEEYSKQLNATLR